MPRQSNFKKTTNGKTHSKRMTFDQRVRGVLNTVAERKMAKLSVSGATISPAMIEPYRLMPDIRQGVTAQSRLGNEISIKKLTIKGFIRIPSTDSASGDTEHLSRMFIIKQRDVNSYAIIDSALTANPLFDANNLMEYQSAYTGSPESWLQSVNADSFIVRRDIRKHYSVSANFQGNDPEVPQPDSIKFFNITLTFGKGKRLHYPEDTNAQSGDFPYFLTCAIHQPDGSTTAGAPTLEYYTEVEYTDL